MQFLKMADVSSRNVDVKNKTIHAVACFFSRIILKKLDVQQLRAFRSLEKITKSCVKLQADIQYLKFCQNNQLLHKFTNFKLYDVSAQHDKETIENRYEL